MYSVEHGIAIAPTKSGPAPKYPFADMKPGDSFFVPADLPSLEKVSGRIRQSYRSWCMSRHMFMHDRRITIRAVEGGLRVWRLT